MNRRAFAADPSVQQAGHDAYEAAKAAWSDVNNPTEAEEVDAKNARLAASCAKADELLAAD